MGIGFGAERLGHLALRFPRAATMCLLALLVMIGLSLPRLSFDEDIHRVFLSDSARSLAHRAYEEGQEPKLTAVLIHVASAAPLSGEDMTALRDFALELEFLDGVHSVASPFVLRFPPSETAPKGRPVFGAEIRDAYHEDLARFAALNTGLPSFVSTSGHAALLSLSLTQDSGAIKEIRSAIMEEVHRHLPAHLEIGLSGEDLISQEIVSGLNHDLVRLNIWGALIVLIASIIVLRDLRMALLAVTPALLGAGGVLGLSVWLGYPITVLSNVIPILVLVLGVADGVHLAAHMKSTRDVDEVITTVGPACALTAWTTALAFASIGLTGNVQLFEFAVLGALGTMLAYGIVITSFALLARKITFAKRDLPAHSAAVAVRLTEFGLARPRWVIGISAAVAICAAVGFSQTKAWFPLYQNLPDESATLATNDAIARDFGGVFQMVIETHGDWQHIQTLTKGLESVSAPNSVLSEVTFARWLSETSQRPKSADFELLPKEIATRLRPTEGMSRIFVSLPEPMRSDETLAQFDRVYSVAKQAGATQVIGLPSIMRFEAVDLIAQLSKALLVAAIGATLLVALAFRSLRIVPILLIPNALPLLLTGASLHLWMQGQLNPTAVLALTISFGIAIDDTVHFLNRFFTARASGDTLRQAARRAARSAGQVMVISTALLTVGLCSVIMSEFTPIRLFGGLMILTLWAALLIDLLVLPALLCRKETSDD